MNPSDLNYADREHCDVCGNEQDGIVLHARSPIGTIAPVLWSCNRCANPPLLVGWWRDITMLARRAQRKIQWYMLPRKERMARTARTKAMRARIEARRAAREKLS